MQLEKLTLRQQRLVREISQAEMAKRIGIHLNTYVKWEKKPKKISVEYAKKIANVLELDVNDIFFAD